MKKPINWKAGSPLTLWNRLNRGGRILLLALILVLELILILKALPERRPGLPPQPENIIPVQTVTVTAENRPDVVVLPGLVRPEIDAVLAAETAGRITELPVDRGDRVRAGQVLLKLDDRTARAAADAARVTLQDAERKLKRIESLIQSGAVSQQDLDDARKARDLADARLREAQAALSWCTVKSPINGLVNERFVEQGEYATPGRQLFNVVRIHPVRVTLDIPERDIRSLNIGDTLPFDIISRPNETFEGTVSYISAKAASGNNAFRVELTAPNPEHKLRPGMIASVRHQRGIREKAVTLPLEAVIPQKGDNVVYLVRDGKAMRQVVRIDALLAQEAVILSGVEAGDQVVTRGNRMLTDGTPVTIRNPGKNGG